MPSALGASIFSQANVTELQAKLAQDVDVESGVEAIAPPKSAGRSVQ